MNPSPCMRISSCNFYCPSFICFSKPSPSTSSSSSSSSSAAIIHSSSALGSENGPPSNSPPPPSNTVDNLPSPCQKEIVEERQNPEVEIVFKSCIRSDNGNGRRLVDKKKVQWMDNFGKELVDIREFEASSSGDEFEDEGGCLCVIA